MTKLHQSWWIWSWPNLTKVGEFGRLKRWGLVMTKLTKVRQSKPSVTIICWVLTWTGTWTAKRDMNMNRGFEPSDSSTIVLVRCLIKSWNQQREDSQTVSLLWYPGGHSLSFGYYVWTRFQGKMICFWTLGPGPRGPMERGCFWSILKEKG